MENPKSYHNSFSDEVCDYIINMYANNLFAARTLGDNVPEGYRNANNTWIWKLNDPIINQWEYFIEELTGYPRSHFEAPHIVKYDVGGEYKEHHDFFHGNTKYYERCMSAGGQRTHTAILYLNDDFTGGETFFKKKNITIVPKKGDVCYWYNVNSKGQVLSNTLHAGLPVTSGTKYILVTWVRQFRCR